MGDDDSGLVLNLVSNVEPTNKVSFSTGQAPQRKKTSKNRKSHFGHSVSHSYHGNSTSQEQPDASGGSKHNFSFNFPTGKSIVKKEGRTQQGKQDRVDGKAKQTPSQPTNNIISSLFRHNPDIPQVHVKNVTQNQEAVFSSTLFSDLPLHSFMVSNLEKNLGFSQMTTVQQRAIPTILQGRDTLVKSQTGSGKTLTYAIPVVQQLQGLQPKIQRVHGPYAVILVPTRELALQSFDSLQKLIKPFQWVVPGCLMGGERKKSEKARLRRGINILVSTPGRLVDHINSTKSLSFSRVKWVILDEADRLLDMGFERDVSAILNAINDQCQSQKQTVLLSATLSEGVKRLASVTLKEAVFIDVAKSETECQSSSPFSARTSSSEMSKPTDRIGADVSDKTSGNDDEDGEAFTIPERLRQQFVIVPSKLRLVTLTALMAGRSKGPSGCKMLVFLSSRESVEFHYTLFRDCLGCSTLQGDGTMSGKEGLPLFRLHGSLSQEERTQTYHAFSIARKGVLLCTDVAARGLDLPKVKWIVQYNTPGTPADYVHRVGRTARIGKEGHALLFLTPSEVEYVCILEQQKIRITEQSLQDILSVLTSSEAQDFIHGQFKGQMQRSVEEAATNLQLRFEGHVLGNPAHTQHARKAFHSFVRAYATYPSSVKHIFHVRKLHLGHAAKSFGLREAPSNINGRIGSSSSSGGGSGAGGRGSKRKLTNSGRYRDTKAASISEFDSGLDELTQMATRPKKVKGHAGGQAARKKNLGKHKKRFGKR
ncbi:ATP-dependent DNA helicase DDX31-like [Diadema antillarum]|uniref:ATP-dependent DNA helicase DDX31-like n=1 Tax=Diadema antillarum TaxID=105358 RepID=UPI003A86242A